LIYGQISNVSEIIILYLFLRFLLVDMNKMQKTSFLSYITSRRFGRNIVIALAITAAFFIGVFIMLKYYTDHNESITVPDLTGFEKDEMKAELEKRALRFSIIDSVYLQSIPKGSVADQYPKPGKHVKSDRVIFITMNAKGREKILMPDLKGVSLRQAKAIIENRGLNLGGISYIPDIAINNVLKQKFNNQPIAAGDTVYKGASIHLVLGGGLSDTKTFIPNVIGQNFKAATDKITDSYLNVGGTIFDNTVENAEDSSNAMVWKQSPDYDPDRLMRMGSLVDIWLTVDSTKLPGYESQDTDNDEIW